MSIGDQPQNSPTSGAKALPASALAQQSKTVNAYLRSKVMSASPQELRLMLLDGAIRFANQGREALATKNFEVSFNGFSSCREIIIELLTSIRANLNPELASRMKALYSFMYKHLVEGVHEKDFTKIDSVIELLTFERETWVMAVQKAADEAGIPSAREAKPAGLSASLAG